ncbi:MAG: Flp family type IVb pilin [Caldilineaceae bacterium]
MLTQLIAMVNGFVAFSKNEEGQGLAEYALILVLIAIVVIAALTTLGTQIDTVFGDITAGLGG